MRRLSVGSNRDLQSSACESREDKSREEKRREEKFMDELEESMLRLLMPSRTNRRRRGQLDEAAVWRPVGWLNSCLVLLCFALLEWQQHTEVSEAFREPNHFTGLLEPAFVNSNGLRQPGEKKSRAR